MKLLLHICCAPCSIMCIETLRQEGIEPVGFWDNPNIHPYTEYRSRKNCLVDYAKDIGLELILHGDYGLRPFVQTVADNIDGRCAYCYRVRMEETARYAAEHGFDSFTTSLLISPYQNHEAICAVARAMGGEYGVGGETFWRVNLACPKSTLRAALERCAQYFSIRPDEAAGQLKLEKVL